MKSDPALRSVTARELRDVLLYHLRFMMRRLHINSSNNTWDKERGKLKHFMVFIATLVMTLNTRPKVTNQAEKEVILSGREWSLQKVRYPCSKFVSAEP